MKVRRDFVVGESKGVFWIFWDKKRVADEYDTTKRVSEFPDSL
jgi:hypothetical protein